MERCRVCLVTTSAQERGDPENRQRRLSIRSSCCLISVFLYVFHASDRHGRLESESRNDHVYLEIPCSCRRWPDGQLGLCFVLVFICGRFFLDQEHESEGRITVQIVSMQSLAPQKPQAFIQLHCGSIGDLSLECDLRDSQHQLASGLGLQYLIGVPFDHDVEGFSNQLRGNPLPSITLSNGEHGNIASHGSTSMRFQLGDNNADQTFILIQSLSFGSNTAYDL